MAAMTEKKYTLEELKYGMKVKKSQLSDVLDTYIVLTDVCKAGDDLVGRIGFIGPEITNEVAKLRSKITPITCIYNNSTELGDDVVYDE